MGLWQFPPQQPLPSDPNGSEDLCAVSLASSDTVRLAR